MTGLAHVLVARRSLLHPRAIGDVVLDLVFPAQCSGCKREGPPICGACMPGLTRTIDRAGGVLFGLPADVPPPLVQVEWCAPFEGLVRNALHDLKYAGERRLARLLGVALADRWRRVGVGGDVLVPVPVHRARRLDRGFDQAVLLATAAGTALGLPVGQSLERSRATVAQFELDRRRRATNVKGAFRVRAGASGSIAGRWVVLIDDVMTTGSTLAACGEALIAGGARAVSALTVARER